MILSPENPFQRYGFWLRKKFNCKVYKIPLHAGFSCPNLDGQISRTGCTYCNNASFHPHKILEEGDRLESIGRQIRTASHFLRREFRVEKFIAYFQTYSNTYGPVSLLEKFTTKALQEPNIVGVAIATRPDCIDKEKIRFLSHLAGTCFVTLEYGLQTIHEKTLKRIGRGHDLSCFEKTLELSVDKGFKICVHVILGLPGESYGDMMETARYLATLPIDSIKIHNLYIAKKTILANQYQRLKFPLLSLEEYVEIVCDFLEQLSAKLTIQRLCADTREDLLIAPSWSRTQEKPLLLAKIRECFLKRGTFQGYHYP